MQIRKAERKQAKLRIGISGASGGGKTWSALEIAHGMGGKIGFIDTEKGRGELYAGSISKYDNNVKFKYDIIRLDAPFTPERYIEAIQSFEANGYDVVIIDSLSHAWNGAGGVLEIVDRGGGWFNTGGKIATPKQNALIDAIIGSKMHIIANLRAKTEYVVELNDRGKNVPRKIGLTPIQRDGIEYEFTLFMNMNQDHYATVTKDNSGIYNEEPVRPSPDMGKKLVDWVNQGMGDAEDFLKNTLPFIMDQIAMSNDADELKEVYLRAYHQYSKDYPIEFKLIEEAKNEKKIQLIDEVLDDDFSEEPVKVSGPIIKTKANYSTALTRMPQ